MTTLIATAIITVIAMSWIWYKIGLVIGTVRAWEDEEQRREQ